MRLLISATSLAETGGIESHLLRFCEVMSPRGHALTIVCGDSRLSDDWARRLGKVANCRFSRIGNSRVRLLWQVKEGIRSRFEGYDALYTNGQGSSVLWFALAAGPKWWVHHHHMAADEREQQLWTPAYRAALKRCDVLVGCAELNSQRLGEATQRQAATVYCFSRRLTEKRPDPTANRRLRFGYFGRLIPAKGIPEIIRLSALPELEDIEWHVWGSGENFADGSYGDASRVVFHGPFTSDEQLDEIASFLDAFVLFSTFDEGLPVSLLEVSSAGLPWISTNRGGIPELAVDETCTSVLPATPDLNDCAISVRKLADAIRAGHASTGSLTNLYNQKFGAERLASEWERCLTRARLGTAG